MKTRKKKSRKLGFTCTNTKNYVGNAKIHKNLPLTKSFNPVSSSKVHHHVGLKDEHLQIHVCYQDSGSHTSLRTLTVWMITALLYTTSTKQGMYLFMRAHRSFKMPRPLDNVGQGRPRRESNRPQRSYSTHFTPYGISETKANCNESSVSSLDNK